VVDVGGKEALMLAADGRVRLFRGGILPDQEVWSWPPEKSFASGADLEVLGVRSGQVVVRSLNGEFVIGLDVPQGKVRWRCRAESDERGAFSLPLLTASDRRPLVISMRPGEGAVCRKALPVHPEGRYRSSPGETRTYESLEDDPRWLAALPWSRRDTANFGLHQPIWTVVLSTFLVIAFPLWLLRRAIRNESGYPVVVMLLWMALLVGVLWLIDGWIPGLDDVPGPSQALGALLLGGLWGFPYLVLLIAVVRVVQSRSWGSGLLLVVVFLGFCGLIVQDELRTHRLLDSQSYSITGWHFGVWGVPLFCTGWVVLVGFLPWRLMRWL
jgi:hypothetical protein